MTAVTLGLLIVLVYFLFRLGTTEAEAKTVTVSINGLAETYQTESSTVGELLTELNLTPQVISVTPDRSTSLNQGDTITVATRPAPRNTVVAANMQQSIQQVAEAAKKKAEEVAQKAAEAAKAAEEALKPKSPTYYGMASWYSFGTGMNAASTQFPKGTRLRVIAVDSGKTIIITINDYGPEDWTGVMLDLNKPALAKLAPLGAGKIFIKYYKV